MSDFTKDVITYVKTMICLDHSREEFLRMHGDTIYQLINDLLIGSTRHRGTLLGRKGVGKTILLNALCHAVQHFLPNLMILKISCDTEHGSLCHHICRKLGILDCSWTEIVSILEDSRRHMFVVIDEFQNSFNESFPNGEDFISQIHGLGGELCGRFHCILSGSSVNLRKLISAKLSREDAANRGFSRYKQMDLNETKFEAYTITPFLTKTNFESLVNHVEQKLNTVAVNRDTLYLDSGGFPSHVFGNIQRQRPCESYTIDLRDVENDSQKLEFLVALLKFVREQNFIVENDNEEDNSFQWTTMVPLHVVSPNIPVGTLYDLADEGYIQFNDVNPKRVGFYSPRIFMELLMRDKVHLCLTELVSLVHPHHMYQELAEATVAKLLMQCDKFWKSIHVSAQSYSRGFKLDPLILPEDESTQSEIVSVPRGILLREVLGAATQKDTDFCDGGRVWENPQISIKIGEIQSFVLRIGKNRFHV